jgi:hypothetical protein
LLSFTYVYFFESRLFNELESIQIKFFSPEDPYLNLWVASVLSSELDRGARWA